MSLELKKIIGRIKGELIYHKSGFVVITFAIALETISLILSPQILSEIIDGLKEKTDKWIYSYIFIYCVLIVIHAGAKITNTYFCEKVGRSICEYLREDVFRKMYSLKMQYHKKTKTSDFLEKIEGDVNNLVDLFSSMSVRVIENFFLLIGVLIVFYCKQWLIGVIISLLSLIILIVFIKSQERISNLWGINREKETNVMGGIVENVRACKDVVGMQAEMYMVSEFKKQYAELEKSQIRATFWGNLPSTMFYSMLNVGEGIVLLIGIYLLNEKKFTIGDVYLILSYVGFLNTPFLILKQEFLKLQMALASVKRVNEVYDIDVKENKGKELDWNGYGEICFTNVFFGYTKDKMVLENCCFSIESGEHVMIVGRTGSGKSTILHLLAGFYEPLEGAVWIGGEKLRDYCKENYRDKIYYILQSNPIVEDTIRNNITRYNKRFTNEQIKKAIQDVKLDEWFNKRGVNLDTVVTPQEISKDISQLFAWAGAILWKPKLLLVDEFDALINDDTIKIIDDVINKYFRKTTIILVTHKARTTIDISRILEIGSGAVLSER